MELFLTILILIAKNEHYTNVKQIQPTLTREIVVVSRPKELYQEAKVSYYDRSVCTTRTYGSNCKTANGDIFNDQDLTLAHKSLKFGTRVEFRYNDSTVICRINDRGPYIDGREFDLSSSCFNKLSSLSKGIVTLQYRIIE